jgi:hypothetical protein
VCLRSQTENHFNDRIKIALILINRDLIILVDHLPDIDLQRRLYLNNHRQITEMSNESSQPHQ